jgi:hypothetical protein
MACVYTTLLGDINAVYSAASPPSPDLPRSVAVRQWSLTPASRISVSRDGLIRLRQVEDLLLFGKNVNKSFRFLRFLWFLAQCSSRMLQRRVRFVSFKNDLFIRASRDVGFQKVYVFFLFATLHSIQIIFCNK